MICPNCRTENPEAAKFCNNCGNRLASICPVCGHHNPPEAKFCNECGQRLGESSLPLSGKEAVSQPSLPEKKSNLPNSQAQTLIPEEFAAKLEGARQASAMVGERRTVTMLFCDVMGSTLAAEKLDPEEWAEIMNNAFETMIQPVYAYEGIVARLMGDAVLAFFGAPIAHEEDPQRAILAGLKIIEGFGDYKNKVLKKKGLDIDVRVGINTGLVMVGAIGSDLRMEYTAMGDAINLASRMEQTAEPGTVQVAENTYQLVAPVFEWEDLGLMEVKGKAKPVHTYRPIRIKTQWSRLRGIQGLDSPLVGRESELETLQRAANRLEKGLGGIVFILGEAGLGKSRLVYELLQSLRADHFPIDWGETASLSYESNQPYALFQRLLRRRWEIPQNTPSEIVRERIARQFETLPPVEQAQFQETFEILMGVSPAVEQKDGETFKRGLFQGLRALWDPERPTLFFFDDLHWSDLASIELLERLFESTESNPLLVICAMRLDRNSPGWEIKEAAARDYPHRYTEISLHPLTGDESQALVNNLLTSADLPSRLRGRILSKTDGNPFFVEEVVRTLIDSGAIVPEVNGGQTRWRAAADVDDIEIPGNLQALLVARIDRLEEDARHTLQLASVIGRTFYYRVLETINQALGTVHSELNRQLLALQKVELIQEAARVPELEYIFRHSLTQEAAYNTILLRQRREFHRTAGEAIETLFADRLEEFFPMLAYHFAEANDHRALEFAILSGDAAFRLYAIPEALEHYTRALAFVDLDSESTQRLTHVYLRRGRCMELQGNYPDALRNYTEMSELARRRGAKQMTLAALQAQATAYSIPGMVHDAEKGEAFAREALKLAQEVEDREAEAAILWILMLVKMYSGFMRDGLPYGEQSAALARELGMSDQLAHSLQDLGLAYMGIGLYQKADSVLKEARPIWERTRNLPMLAENMANTAYIRVMQAKFDEAVAVSEESYRIARSIDNRWGQVNARTFGVLADLARGEVDRTLEKVTELIESAKIVSHPAYILGEFYLTWLYSQLGAEDLAREAAWRCYEASANFPPFRSLGPAILARGRIQEGALEQAFTLLEEADQPGSRQTLQIVDQIVDIVTVEYYLARSDYDRAEEHLEVLLDKIDSTGGYFFLPDALHLKTHFLQLQGRSEEAAGTLREARAAAEATGSRITLWQILAESGEIEAAREEVESIAGKISDPTLRETFINHAKAKIEGGEHRWTP